MSRARLFTLLFSSLCLCVSVVTIPADEPKRVPEAYKHLTFRSLGPAAGGRVCRACGVPGDPRTYYAATAAGGLWKSSDGGYRWASLMDDMPTSTIGSLAVAPSDPNVLYAGSGEANIRGNVEVGNGIYRSTDAGKTWKHVWKQEGQIGTLIAHPKDPDVAFAAVLGKAFGPNPQRGVYRTSDGGNTWKRVLSRNEDTGASDVCFDPSNPRILFAGLWQARRRPWEMTSGGPGSGLYLSRDGGDSWTQLVAPPKDDSPEAAREAAPGTKRCKGLPQGSWGKVCLAIAPSDPKRIYTLIEAEQGGLFRSDDGGDTWERVNPGRALRQRAWYFSTMTVHPKNPDLVFFPQVPLLKSVDGGKTLSRVKGPHHGDHHDLWIDPTNPDRIIDSNDGGVDISLDGGKLWYAPPLPIAQLYHIDVDRRTPFRIACSMQDLGSVMGPSHNLTAEGNPLSGWYPVGGGEAGHIAIDPADPDVVYAGEYGGYISRYDHRTRQAKPISVYPYNASGHGAVELKYRFQWTAPILISPHDRRTVYHAANVVFRTGDAGRTWAPISKDLTRNDKNKQKWSGGPITGDNTGVEVYGTVFALAESPRQKGLLWAGSDDGLVHVTTDGGESWRDVTAGLTKAGLPEWGTVTCIEPSPFDANTAYVVVDAHRIDDRRPYLFVTTDLGKTWKSLAEKMPDIGYLQVIREDPKRRGTLYVGGEQGLVYATDGGGWQRLKLNLPTVRVTDLRVREDALVVGTNGRSIWVFDDLTPLRAAKEEWSGKVAHLFPAGPAYRYRYTSAIRPVMPMSAGDNPPRGATLHYSLKARPAGVVKLELLGPGEKVVRTLTSKEVKEKGTPDPGSYSEGWKPPKPLPAEPGLHRVVWDLRMEGAEAIPSGRVDTGVPQVGPFVNPGSYTVRLSVEGKTYTTPLEVRPDPRQNEEAGEIAGRLRLTLQVRDDITALTRAVEQLRSVRQQVQDREKLLADDENAVGLLREGKALVAKLDRLEGQMHNPKAEVSYDILAMKGGARLYSQLIWLFEQLKDADGEPTQGVKELYAEQSALLKKYRERWQTLVDEDVARLNALARKLELPGVVVPAKR